jgi:glycosyltransferase involved in cell wall biosynthesis
MKLRLALVVSHPIQHFCPQYVSFAANENIEFKVFFASRLGLEKYMDENFMQEISWSNLNLHQFNHQFVNGDAVFQSDKNIDAPLLNNALDEYKPDVVICYGYFQKLQRRAYQWAKKNKVAIAYISDSELRHKQSRLKKLLKYPFLRNYFSGINYFFTVGDANEAFYAHYGVSHKKMLRMHFPIDVKTYEKSWANKDDLRKTVREQYNIGEEEIVLTVVGKLVWWKNQDHIIEAMLQLEKQEIFLKLFIIGSGQMTDVWKIKASLLKKSKVFFTGFIGIEELPAYYAATDIYVHPALVEPHSIAISEAIFMGCPVVVSDTSGSYGSNDDVQENYNGQVFTFGNIDQLSQKIKLLAKDNILRQSFGKYSHNNALNFQRNAHYLILEKLANKLGGNKVNTNS